MSTKPIPSESSLSDHEWKGKTLLELCQRFGNPDRIEPAEHYSAKFSEGSAAVVLTYKAEKRRWYVTENGRVLGVVAVKE